MPGARALVDAAKIGDVKAAIRLLDRGARAEEYKGGGIALERAAQSNHLEMAKLLLDRGARADSNDRALNWAAQENHLEMAKLLLDRGARAGDNDSKALERAVRGNHLEMAKLLLEWGARADSNDSKALYWAAQENHLEMAKLLLDRGARADNNDSAELLRAARSNHLEMAKLLLDRGARADDKDSKALNWAVRGNHLEMAKLLLDRGARADDNDSKALNWAAFENHPEMARLLLDRGARADDKDSKALNWAVRGNHLEMAKLLLDRGARADDNDSKALNWAAQENHLEMAKLLLDRGARADDKDSKALNWAAQENHLEMARLLLDRGARADDNGSKALNWAAFENHPEMARLLLDRGARADDKDSKALNWAVRGNHLEMAKLLLDRGARADDNDSKALNWAAFENHPEMARLLLDRGARADDKDSKALNWAVRGNHLEMAKLLLDRGARADNNDSAELLRAARSNHLEMAKLLLEKGARAERLDLGLAQKLREVGADASALLPCFVRHASLPDVRECIDAECLDINAEIHLEHETRRVISAFRDCFDSVIELMGEGGRCGSLVIRGPSAIQNFSRDRQNVHTSVTSKALCRNVQAAYKILEESSIGFSLEESPTLLELETELKSKNIPDLFWQEAQEANRSSCSGRGLAEIRRAVIQAFNRFKMDLDATPSPSPLVTSGPQALALVYRALRAALSGRPDFNPRADVLSPIASALLQTQSEYGWNDQACGLGSVSMVLQVLEGRVDVDEAPSVAPLQALLTDIAGWKKTLQKTTRTAEYHALVAEVQARLLEISDRAKLQEVYDCIIDGDHTTYCVNKLRGLLFQALTKEFGDDLAKHRAEAEHDNARLWGLIQDLGDVAEIFTQVCTAHMVEVVDPVSVSPRYSTSTAESVAVAHCIAV